MRKLLSIALLSLAVLARAGAAPAAVQTKEVEYESGGTPLQGFLAWDDAHTGKRPACW